jgi:hypothetical protein
MDFDNFSAPTYTDATKGVRFANLIIDGIVASILYSILGKILVPDASNYRRPRCYDGSFTHVYGW